MRTAIVHDWLTGMRGGERVLEIFCELFPDADIYTLFYFPEKISNSIQKHHIIKSRLQSFPFVRRHYRKLLPLFPAAIESFDLSAYDLVISTSHAVAKGAVPGTDAISICYCHTPMRYIWDMFDTYFRSPETSAYLKYAMMFFRDYLQHWDKTTSSRVNYFIANSRFVAARISKYYERTATVINPPVDIDTFSLANTTPGDYYLIVSALAPYKRIDLAIDAFNRTGKKLVIIGDGQDYEKLKARAEDNIEFLGKITSDAEVCRYYQQSRALIFPGVEDFGLTPLESQACGRPVIAYARGGVLETVIEGITGHFFSEQTVDALINAVYEFEGMDFYADDIRGHASQFGKEVMKQKLISFFSQVVPDLTIG